MRISFDADELRKQLVALPKAASLAFGLLAFERALPGYYKFLTESGLRDRDRLREVGGAIWRGLEVGNVSFGLPAPDWSGLLETEGSASLYATSAIDAVSISYELRDFLTDQSVDHVVNCVSLRIDTVDLYIQNTTIDTDRLSNIDNIVLNHPLMQRELESQYSDLQALTSASSTTADLWFVALSRYVDGRYSSLRLAL